jgi:hypothetical protein
MGRGAAQAYQLQLSDVLLPPEVRLVFWPHISHEIVSVHEHVDERVCKSHQDNMTTCKKHRIKCNYCILYRLL